MHFSFKTLCPHCKHESEESGSWNPPLSMQVKRCEKCKEVFASRPNSYGDSNMGTQICFRSTPENPSKEVSPELMEKLLQHEAEERSQEKTKVSAKPGEQLYVWRDGVYVPVA